MKVSIVTPTYNRAEALPEVIASVARQSFRDYEHIIVDDASEDHTDEIVAELTYENLRYISHDTNRGANAARNTGIDAADGEYVCFLDSDDQLLQDHLQTCVDALDRLDASVGGVYTSSKLVRDGELFGYQLSQESVTLEDIVDANVVGGFSGTMFRSEVFQEVGDLDLAFPASQDYEFYLRVLQSYEMRGIEEALVRRDYSSEQRISRDAARKREGFERILGKHGDLLSEQRVAQQAFSEAIYHGEQAEMDAAADRFRRALRADPTRASACFFLAASLVGHDFFVRSLDVLRTLRKHKSRAEYWWQVERAA